MVLQQLLSTCKSAWFHRWERWNGTLKCILSANACSRTVSAWDTERNRVTAIYAGLLMFSWTSCTSCLLFVPMHTGRSDLLWDCQVARKQHVLLTFECVSTNGCSTLLLRAPGMLSASISALSQGCWGTHWAGKDWKASVMVKILCSISSWLIPDIKVFPPAPQIHLFHALVCVLAKKILSWLWVKEVRICLGRDTVVTHQETVQMEVLSALSVKWCGHAASCETACHVEVTADSLLLALEVGAVTQSVSRRAVLLHDRWIVFNCFIFVPGDVFRGSFTLLM